MLPYIGVEIFFRPKAEAREIWLLCSIYEPILQKGKTICCQQNVFLEVHIVIRMSIQTDVLIARGVIILSSSWDHSG